MTIAVPFEDVARTFRAQLGKPYRLRAEWPVAMADPPDWDCSELVEWALGRHGIEVPDGAYRQHQVMVQTSRAWPGSFIFGWHAESRTKENRLGIDHVNFVIDDTHVIEARKDYGSVILRPIANWMGSPIRYGPPMRLPNVVFLWPDGRPTIGAGV